MARFNTDTKALARRIEAHTRCGAHDINPWIFERLDVKSGHVILELGCGTGKQTLPLAEGVGQRGRVAAVDISQEALDVLAKDAATLGVADRVSTIRMELDDLESNFLDYQQFDRVLGAHSLYYARNPDVLFAFVHRILRTDGVLFFCGPAADNNSGLKDFHYALKHEKPPTASGASTFMEVTGPRLAQRLFRSVAMSAFENPLRIDSAEALYTYWSSYNLYDEALDRSFRSAADKYFRVNPIFETVKRVVGVRAIK